MINVLSGSFLNSERNVLVPDTFVQEIHHRFHTQFHGRQRSGHGRTAGNEVAGRQRKRRTRDAVRDRFGDMAFYTDFHACAIGGSRVAVSGLRS